jgi:predicted molibdopterin-dependent oxidoreductase YjgC
MPTSERQAASVGTGTTVCPYCGTGCRVLIHGSSAFPTLQDPVSQGSLCLRGWCSAELLWSPQRLTTAVRRTRDGQTQHLPVEAALGQVAERLGAIRAAHGPGSIGILGSARVTVEECRLLARFAHALGTPHLDSFQRLGYVARESPGLEVLDTAGRIVVVGANLDARQVQAGRRVLRAIRRGAEVRFIHSRRVQLGALGASLEHPLPGHEVEALGPPRDDEVVVATTELAIAGRGGALLAALAGRRALLISDHVNQRGMVESGVRPRPEGLSAWEMLQQAAAGSLKALVVFGDDPFELFPALAAEAFARAELTVVADAVRTATTRRAEYVLPGALLAEKAGHVVNFEGRRRDLAALAEPPGGWTEGRLLERLIGLVGDAGDPPLPPEPALDAAGPPPEAPAETYPYMAALDTTTFWNTHALTAASLSTWREGRSIFADFPPGYVTMNPDDARTLGVHYAGSVALRSPGGTVILPARLHPRALPGTVWVPMHAWEHVGSRLGALDFDPVLRIPVFRPRAVRVARPQG